jgi:hypothetical protein
VNRIEPRIVPHEPDPDLLADAQRRALSEHLQDPDFWKALSTSRNDVNAWRFHWHRFIDHLADGKDAESFFAAL